MISIALNAACTNLLPAGMRRHIKGALKAGSTMEEIMEVLKLCVFQGGQTCNLGVPILAEELERNSARQKAMAESMAEFLEGGLVEKLAPGSGTTVTLARKEVTLLNVDGTIYAMDDSCLQHGVSLGTSNVEGKIVTYRGHVWKYDVTTGYTLNVPGYGVSSYPVKGEDGKITIATT